jgi:phosphoribosylformylglycinamidine synthase
LLLKLGVFASCAGSPFMAPNPIGRHISRMVSTKIISNRSPWLCHTQVNDVYSLPVSQSEGRFVCGPEIYGALAGNGQIAAVYADGHNVFHSDYAIEAITGADGRILGKLTHSERAGIDLYRNSPGEHDQGIFRAGVGYFM